MIDRLEDGASFATLIDRHSGIIRKVATTYCRNAEDRADLAQEIAAQLWKSWPRFDGRRSFSTWMYRVALNVALSHVRSVYRDQEHFVPLAEDHDNIPDARTTDDTRQMLSALEAFISRLDGLNRALLLLYIDERSHREISEILGISESNVGTKIGRLKARIRDELN